MIYESLVAKVPQLARGQVWCRHCSATRKVNAAGALSNGWPKCCNETMTIDSPAEQKRLAGNQDDPHP